MSNWRRPSLVPGIYDEVVSQRVEAELKQLGPELSAVLTEITQSQSVSAPLGSVLRAALDLALADREAHLDESLSLAHDVLQVLRRHAPKAFPRDVELQFRAQRLTSIVTRPAEEPDRPKGSLHTSSLIVNAEGDSLLEHLRSEFDSADSVDLLCAFVKLSGVEKLRAALERHCVARGRPLRVLTTTYMGASDAKAVERLARLPGAEVRVSFDEQVTRLHAKAWVFHRKSGVSTAYVGSSNLSHAAQTDGLEWNVRLAEADQPGLLEQMKETFQQYWSDPELFERFDAANEAHRTRLSRALSSVARRDDSDDFFPEIEAKDFQKPVLEELVTARGAGRHRNLLVAATGTGKTVMAALDYRRLREERAVDSLLFVAHRREILEQAQRVFRSALQLRDFGELLFDGRRLEIGRHVFASIDSIADDTHLDPSKFDFVVLDEAHHSAANTWDALLRRIKPKELLGLTGTPERADGLDYETHFPRPWVGNLRLWNAIPNALVPFRYYSLDVKDVDLSGVRWGPSGYARSDLETTLVSAADAFVLRATQAIAESIGRPSEMRAIAFCVDVRHANEVAKRFNNLATPFRAEVLTADTPATLRRSSRDDLNAGRIQILCVVDLYNEGVDVPNVNTLFFFRPTESATVFLQQLGRGLRRARGKAELVVFDLTGRQHHNFRFDRRLRAMLGQTPRELRELVSTGFGRLPSGCHLQFDEIAREQVLEQLQRAIPDDLRGLRELLREPAQHALTLSQFLHQTDVELESIYRKAMSWTLLRREAGIDARPLVKDEEGALKQLHKLLHVGDERRLGAWEQLVRLERPKDEISRRLMRMLFAVLYGKELAPSGDAWAAWERHSALREELASLVGVLRTRNALLPHPHVLEPSVPLVLHGRYLGVELSAAFDQRTQKDHFRDYYTGVVATGRDGRYDMLLVTLDKDSGVKEHLRYRDFPLNETRFHWQSRADTAQSSRQGGRHLGRDPECTPLLFVRERNDDRPGVTMAFQYLGPVTADAFSGERPITIEWKLAHPLPLALLRRGRIAA
jgi:superfamily II DNA or RNA helicase/HKD family nuclease